MSGPLSNPDTIDAAIAGLGAEPLDEEGVRAHLAPLFSRVLQRREIYLANHSLGRPLDASAGDVTEAMALWQAEMREAWTGWLAEMEAYRARFAALLGTRHADSVVPKAS